MNRIGPETLLRRASGGLRRAGGRMPEVSQRQDEGRAEGHLTTEAAKSVERAINRHAKLNEAGSCEIRLRRIQAFRMRNARNAGTRSPYSIGISFNSDMPQRAYKAPSI